MGRSTASSKVKIATNNKNLIDKRNLFPLPDTHVWILTVTTEYEECVSGFKVRGTWDEIVTHGERITYILEQFDETVDEDRFDDWNQWRPKITDRYRSEMMRKTAEQASIEEGKGEQEDIDPKDDLYRAGEELVETPETLSAWDKSFKHLTRACDTKGRKWLRYTEHLVYERLMTVIAPYYFDNELISANLYKVERNPPLYEFEVNVNDDTLKERVSNELASLTEEHDRWHVSTPKNTEYSNAAEGTKVQEDNDHDATEPTQT